MTSRERLVELGYSFGWWMVRVLPRPVVWVVFDAGARRAARRRNRGRGTIRLASNLRRVVGPDVAEPEFQRLLLAALRSYARYWLEFFRLPDRSTEQILQDFHLEGEHLLAEAVAAGKGVVLALPHAGNWDAAGAWVAARGWPISTVAERVKPERLYQRFLDARSRIGMDIIPLTGGDRPVFDVLLERLAAGYVVPLLADRDLSARGVEVELFGEQAKIPAGPALLAIRSGAPLFLSNSVRWRWLWFEPGRALAKVKGPMVIPDPDEGTLSTRVRLLTQRIADDLAEGIATHPADWHMMQRVWTRQPAETSAQGPTGT